MTQAEHAHIIFMCWCSPPCRGRSPVLNLNEPERRAAVQQEHLLEFTELMAPGEEIVESCSVRSLELSKSRSYWKSSLVQTNPLGFEAHM